MIFEKYLLPDLYVADIYELDGEYLKNMGICAVVSDIDNTLVTYDDPEPTKRLLAWIDGLEACGIKLAFVSNNNEQRVKRFNEKLGFFASHKSGKPSGKYIKLAMEYMGSTAQNTVMLGDQLLTDALAGKRCGLRCIIVPPIKDKTNLFFRFKRLLEKPYIKKYRKIHLQK